MSELKTGEYPPQWGVGPDEKTGDKLSRTISFMALSTSYKNLDAHLKFSHSINQGMFLFPPSDRSRTSNMQMFNFSAGYRFNITKNFPGG